MKNNFFAYLVPNDVTVFKLHLTLKKMAKCYFKAVKNNKNFDFFQNLISVATLIRAYLDEKPSEINTRSYMFIRKYRVAVKYAHL